MGKYLLSHVRLAEGARGTLLEPAGGAGAMEGVKTQEVGDISALEDVLEADGALLGLPGVLAPREEVDFLLGQTLDFGFLLVSIVGVYIPTGAILWLWVIPWIILPHILVVVVSVVGRWNLFCMLEQLRLLRLGG